MNLKCHVKKFKFYIFCFWLILLVIIGAYILCGKKTETISISSGEKRELLAVSGTCGTCNWTIDNNGKLTIMAGTLDSINNTENPPWYTNRGSIKTVHVNQNVKAAESFCNMFKNCTNLTSANLSNLNASNTKYLVHVFDGCSSLTSVTFGNNCVTTNALQINHMFQGCVSLETVDLSLFKTSNITSVASMFQGCGSLTSITWGSFNTGKVKDFTSMFNGCYSLEYIGKAIGTPSATSMAAMFANCSKLKSVNLSNFNTSKVTSVSKMFLNCVHLTSLDLSTFSTSTIASDGMSRMLEGLTACNQITFSSSFRFKKSSTSMIQIMGPASYYWKYSTTIKTSLQLENTTGAVTGTWIRQCLINYYQGSNQIKQSTINAGDSGNLTAYSGTAPTNWTFYGWSTSSTGVTRNYANSASITNAPVSTTTSYIKLYAVFSRNLTITYNGNGNTGGSTANTTKVIYYNPNNASTSSQAVNLRTNGYTKTGYSFVGWNTASNGSGTNYSAGASYNPGLAYSASSFTKTLYANWSSSTLNYTVNHYVHNIGTNTYTKNLTQTFTGNKGSSLTLANLSIEITGFTYVEGFVNAGNTTKPTSGAVATTTIPSSGSLTINLYYRRYYLYVSYHCNGGTLASDYGSTYGMSGEYITHNNVKLDLLMGVYGSPVYNMNINTYAANNSAGLANYNNPAAINIVRSGYIVEDSKEWYTIDDDGNKTVYSQEDNTNYDANTFVANAGYDLSIGDVYVTLYVNWVPEEYTITYDANGGTVDPASDTVTYDDYYGELAIPEKTGYKFNGWSILPTGYTQLEYIESTGTQLFNTEYYTTSRTGIKAKFQYTDLTTQQVLFGQRPDTNETTNHTYQFYINGSSNFAYGYNNGNGNWIDTSVSADNEINELSFNLVGNKWIINNENSGTIQGEITNTTSRKLYIMATNRSGNIANYSKVKLYEFSIYEAGVLQKRMIPCIRPSDNKIGMYDIVNNIFWVNAGTGTFIAGPEVFVTESNIVETPFDHTLYANWTINNYTIEYYQGNNGQDEEDATLLGSSSHTYNVPANLNVYNGTEPDGWEFAGWSSDGGVTSTSVVYTNQQSINNLTEQSDGIVSLYAIFKRTIKFNSGLNKATTSNELQYYNPYTTTLVSEVLAPLPSMTGISNGWGAIGYRADLNPLDSQYTVTQDGDGIFPEYNTGNTSTTVNLYGVYSRTVTFYHGLNKAQTSTPIQYMNTNNNVVSQILAPAPSTIGLSDYSWNAVGYRTDGGLEIGN